MSVLKNMKFLEAGMLGAGKCLNQKIVFSIKKCNFNPSIFNCDVTRSNRPPYDPHIGVVINDGKFGVCMLNGFKSVSLKVINHKIVCCIANNL